VGTNKKKYQLVRTIRTESPVTMVLLGDLYASLEEQDCWVHRIYMHPKRFADLRRDVEANNLLCYPGGVYASHGQVLLWGAQVTVTQMPEDKITVESHDRNPPLRVDLVLGPHISIFIVTEFGDTIIKDSV